MRLSTLIVTITVLALSALTPSHAQDWPKRSVTMIAPFAAGSSIDVVGRILAIPLSESLKQPIVVENVSGAGGMTGSARVARAAPDGYQFLIGSQSTHVLNQLLYKNPLYDGRNDFAPVAMVIGNSKILAMRKDFPATTLTEFIAYARTKQGSLQYGTGGVGSGPHVTCLLLNRAIGIDAVHVPYRGSAQSMQDLIAGRIDYSCEFPPVAAQLVRNGSIKAIAALSPNRSKLLPMVKTAHEQGLTGFDADAWNAFFLPRGTPGSIVQRLAALTSASLDLPGVREQLEVMGYDVPARDRRTPDYLDKLILSDHEKWGPVIKAAGLTAD